MNEEVVNVTENLEEGSQIVTDAANAVVDTVSNVNVSKGKLAVIAVGCTAGVAAVYLFIRKVVGPKVADIKANRKAKKDAKKQAIDAEVKEENISADAEA